MIWFSPSLRFRRGFHKAESCSQPKPALRTIVMAAATRRGNFSSTWNSQVNNAPKVTISPWAKLFSPVVPKINEIPIAATASRRPRFRPAKRRIIIWSPIGWITLVSLPRGKRTAAVFVTFRLASRILASGSRRPTPLGKDSSRISTW